MWPRQRMLPGCSIAGAGPADDGWQRQAMLGGLNTAGCCWRGQDAAACAPPRGCPSNLLSFESQQREVKGFAEREPEEERRSL